MSVCVQGYTLWHWEKIKQKQFQRRTTAGLSSFGLIVPKRGRVNGWVRVSYELPQPYEPYRALPWESAYRNRNKTSRKCEFSKDSSRVLHYHAEEPVMCGQLSDTHPLLNTLNLHACKWSTLQFCADVCNDKRPIPLFGRYLYECVIFAI